MAAWRLIALLIAVFPANLHMALHPEMHQWASPLGLWLRLRWFRKYVQGNRVLERLEQEARENKKWQSADPQP